MKTPQTMVRFPKTLVIEAEKQWERLLREMASDEAEVIPRSGAAAIRIAALLTLRRIGQKRKRREFK